MNHAPVTFRSVLMWLEFAAATVLAIPGSIFLGKGLLIEPLDPHQRGVYVITLGPFLAISSVAFLVGAFGLMGNKRAGWLLQPLVLLVVGWALWDAISQARLVEPKLMLTNQPSHTAQ
jgi:hypothetical protein